MISPYYEREDLTLFGGDCRDVLASLPECSVDAIVTDPPYELTMNKRGGSGVASVNLNSPAGRARITTGFMRKAWDGSGVAYDVATWAACLRVLKPGGHMLAFGAPRTHHRLMCAIEDAGFEIRDVLMWLFGSGFPKSLDVSKAIDKANGDERPVTGTREAIPGVAFEQSTPYESGRRVINVTSAASAAWQGWGTALKPAYEPIVLARKPLRGTVAATVQAYGTGGLNIDGCRIDANGRPFIQSHSEPGLNTFGNGLNGSHLAGVTDQGRWPANILLDEEAAALLDLQSGERPSGYAHVLRRGGTTGAGMGYGSSAAGNVLNATYGDSGGASRFFFVSKENTWESRQNVHVVSDAGIQCASCGTVTALSPALVNPSSEPPATPGLAFIENSAASTPTLSPASSVVHQEGIDTTPTTPSFCGSCGSVLPAIDAPTNLGRRARAEDGNAPEPGTRFLYTSKAARSEREFGLDDLAPLTPGQLVDRKDGNAGTSNPRAGAGRAKQTQDDKLPAWVNEGLKAALQADTVKFLQRVIAEFGTAADCEWSMTLSGSNPTAPYPPDSTFTTTTESSSTTGSIIFDSSTRSRISASIRDALSSMESGLSRAAFAALLSRLQKSIGISPTDGQPTADAALVISRSLCALSENGGQERVIVTATRRNDHPHAYGETAGPDALALPPDHATEGHRARPLPRLR